MTTLLQTGRLPVLCAELLHAASNDCILSGLLIHVIILSNRAVLRLHDLGLGQSCVPQLLVHQRLRPWLRNGFLSIQVNHLGLVSFRGHVLEVLHVV